MKSGRRPTKNQKITLSQHGENPESWLIVKNLPAELHVVHRRTGELKIIPLKEEILI